MEKIKPLVVVLKVLHSFKRLLKLLRVLFLQFKGLYYGKNMHLL